MANPIAASAAATVSTNIANTCPTRSPSAAENATRFKLTASRISSTDMRMMMTFLRLRKMPKMPSTSRMADTTRKCPRPTSVPTLASPVRFRDSLGFRNLRAEDAGLLHARTYRYAHQLQGFRHGALCLRAGALMARGPTVAQRQDDGADHRHQQKQAGSLEQEHVIRVK